MTGKPPLSKCVLHTTFAILQERKFYEKYEAMPLSAKAGSLFLWDSRTAHQNVMPGNLVGCLLT